MAALCCASCSILSTIEALPCLSVQNVYGKGGGINPSQPSRLQPEKVAVASVDVGLVVVANVSA